MSYGTYFTTTLIFNKQTFNSVWQVREEYNKISEELADLRAAIHELTVMTEPAKMMSKEEAKYATPYEWVRAQTRDILKEIESLAVQQAKLSLLIDEWSMCHDKDGRPIPPPESLDIDNQSFICGDFVEGLPDND